MRGLTVASELFVRAATPKLDGLARQFVVSFSRYIGAQFKRLQHRRELALRSRRVYGRRAIGAAPSVAGRVARRRSEETRS